MFTIIAYIFAFAVGFTISGFDAWVMLCYWRWFAVPLGAPSMSFVQALGLSWLAAKATQRRIDGTKKDDRPDDHMAIPKHVLSTVLMLVFGYVLARIGEGQ